MKANWDVNKSYTANLAEMGLSAKPNQLPDEREQKARADKVHVIELFEIPDSDEPNYKARFPLSKEDEKYMSACVEKWDDDYGSMFRDTKVNYMQHTEAKLRKMGAVFLSLTLEQRRADVSNTHWL